MPTILLRLDWLSAYRLPCARRTGARPSAIAYDAKHPTSELRASQGPLASTELATTNKQADGTDRHTIDATQAFDQTIEFAATTPRASAGRRNRTRTRLENALRYRPASFAQTRLEARAGRLLLLFLPSFFLVSAGAAFQAAHPLLTIASRAAAWLRYFLLRIALDHRIHRKAPRVSAPSSAKHVWNIPQNLKL